MICIKHADTASAEYKEKVAACWCARRKSSDETQTTYIDGMHVLNLIRLQA